MKELSDNELIAIFMGMIVEKYDAPFLEDKILYRHGKMNWQVWSVHQLSYHKSWEWLMPVVEKIESIQYKVAIENSECQISGYEYCRDFYSEGSKLHAVYNSVVEFIKWHNNKNATP